MEYLKERKDIYRPEVKIILHLEPIYPGLSFQTAAFAWDSYEPFYNFSLTALQNWVVEELPPWSGVRYLPSP